MEDGVKEETPDKPKCSMTADKAGWIKKSSGGLLSLWKERYIQLCKTQLLMYEDEEEQKCVETVELERYDRCQDLRALLKRKNRFILIRAPGCKVQDIKFQASNGEEKELWMKALNEGINRGKNRILDEVKVDESLSLEHVTRGRAKLGQGRRPPTRNHLKEVASSVSDGILRLDLDVPDSGPPNIILVTNEDADTPPKETPKPPVPPAKPPMPPSEKPSADSLPEDVEVRKPPMPPAKPFKEAAAPSKNMKSVEEEEAEEKEEKKEEEEDDVGDTDDAGDDAEEPQIAPGGENLREASKNSPKAPVPPPKILSDKMKATWDAPASELQGLDAANLSAASTKENLPEVAREIVKPPTPPPKILSEQLRASVRPEESSSEVDTCEGDHRPNDMKPPVNGLHGNGTTEPIFQDGQEPLLLQHEREPPTEQGENKERVGLPSKNQAPSSEPAGNSPTTKPRCASVGVLLSAVAKKPLLHSDLQQGSGLHMAQMEKKVACEQERMEKLLQMVLQGRMDQAQEGNGPPVNAETLLNEAAVRLQQASQVLQEIRDLGELKKEPAERRKGAAKDLVTLYRRSAP